MEIKDQTETPSGEKNDTGPVRKDHVAEFRQMAEKAKKKRKTNIILNTLLVIFAAIFIVSGVFLFRYYHASSKNKEMVSSLKEMIDTEEEDYEGQGESDTSSGQSSGQSGQDSTSSGKGTAAKPDRFVMVNDRLVLRKFRNLYAMNQDFIGWITIEGTNVDYPVVYTPYEEQKYLRKNFEGEYALAGTIFLSADSDPVRPSTNILIYGHHMKDGSMFADLLNYKDQEFYDSHKIIRFDTIYGTNTYEIIAAFQGRVLNVGEEGFRYYTFYDPASEEEYMDYVNNVTGLSSITASSTAVYGDKLITLSTCDSTGANEGHRFVVVAKRIGD